MEPIPEEVVERTWKEVAQFNEAQLQKEMATLGREQRDLLGFVLALTRDTARSVSELALYMFFTVFRMFQKSYGRRIKPISAGKIVACHEANEVMLGSLEGVHDKFLDRAVHIQLAVQPHVMRYVVETLVETEEDEDLRELTEEDKGSLFLLLKTVIDLLDKATEQEGNKRG